jgi:hypothetical protein
MTFLILLPQSVLLYFAELFFVYSVIFHRNDHVIASQYSYSVFSTLSDAYAQKSTKAQKSHIKPK